MNPGTFGLLHLLKRTLFQRRIELAHAHRGRETCFLQPALELVARIMQQHFVVKGVIKLTPLEDRNLLHPSREILEVRQEEVHKLPVFLSLALAHQRLLPRCRRQSLGSPHVAAIEGTGVRLSL